MIRKLLLSAAALAALLPGAAYADWFQASSKHFVVYSNDSSANVKAYAQRLERFDKAISVLHVAKEVPRGPAARVTIFVVDNVDAVQKLHPGAAGFFSSRSSGSVAFMPRVGGDGGLSAQAIMFHEYSHYWMFSNWSDAAFPYWFTEGFAEFHATAIVKPDGAMIFGANPLYRRYTVDNASLMPVPNLLKVKPSENLSGASRDAVYSRGWLLMHYLTFDAERRKQLASYIGAINGGQTPAAAGKLLGNANTLDVKMNSWGAQRRYPSIMLTPAELPIGEVTVRPLTPGEVAIMPALIQSKTGVDDKKSRNVVELARKIAAAFPNDPAVQNELAEAEFDFTSTNTKLSDADAIAGYARAEAAADRAIAAEPKSIHALLYKGMAMEQALVKAKVADPAKWTAARKWFLAANKVDAEDPEPLVQYYESFQLAKVKPTSNAENGVIYAYALAPYDNGVRFFATRALLSQGKAKEARIALAPVAYNAEGGDFSERAQKVLAAIDANDVAGAIKILDTKPDDKKDGKGKNSNS